MATGEGGAGIRNGSAQERQKTWSQSATPEAKYKNSSGEWHHATINHSGFLEGAGNPHKINVTSDRKGAFIRKPIFLQIYTMIHYRIAR